MADQPLLAEVQRDLLDGKPLADLLRKCILLGSQSGSAELRAWATKELRGYDDISELPPYREVPAQIRVDALVGNGWIKGQPLAASQMPEFARGKITNRVPLFVGVGNLESLYESARTSGESPQLFLPGWEHIAEELDKVSGNPFQHIQALYWSMSASAIAGVLDDIRTALTEILAELGVLMPAGQDTPTADQATHALHLAVSGGSPQINIAAPMTSVNALGGSVVEGVSAGQLGVAGHDLQQHGGDSGMQNQAVTAWLDEYRAALPELAEVLQPVVEQQLNVIASELSKAVPHEAVVNGLLGSLKSFAQNAVTSAGAGSGALALAAVVAHWPL